MLRHIGFYFGLCLALLLGLLAVSAPAGQEPKAAGQEPKKAARHVDWPAAQGYVCYRTNTPMTIDGKLDEAAWAAAPWSEQFVDIEGDKQPKPRHKTRMKMLWDDNYLYIAAEIEEPHVWAYLTEHDAVLYYDNDFEVFIDPDGDGHNYGELELNARNTTWDLLLTKPYKDGGRAINAWEILGLKTAVHIDGTLNNAKDVDQGWTVEIAWPYKGLKELSGVSFPPKDGDQWRVNFSRVEWDTEIVDGKYVKVKNKRENNWVWSPTGIVDMHRPERWGYVQFSTAKPGEAKYQPDPAAGTRDLLHKLYYQQKAHFGKHKAYAKTLADLGLDPAHFPAMPTIETTATGFEARMEQPGDTKTRWVIKQDALIQREPSTPKK